MHTKTSAKPLLTATAQRESYQVLKKHRQIWQQKELLRQIYAVWFEWFDRDLSRVTGPTIELGAGGGHYAQTRAKVKSADIVAAEWLDYQFDALHMPFARKQVANLVLLDVLHHLADPVAFLAEAARVLKPGGRLIMLEPFPSFFSLLVYRCFHPEPFIFDIDYFQLPSPNQRKRPWDSNQAIPYLIFFAGQPRFKEKFGQKFAVVRQDKIGAMTYALSGGFEKNSWYPVALWPMLNWLEQRLSWLVPWYAFRCYVVLERKP